MHAAFGVKEDLLLLCWRSEVYLRGGWGGGDRLYEWMRNRTVDVRRLPRESRPQKQGSGRKGPGVEAGGWSDRSVRVLSSIHHTVPLWFNQTRNVLTWYDWKSTQVNAKSCRHLCRLVHTGQKYPPIKWKDTFLVLHTFLPVTYICRSNVFIFNWNVYILSKIWAFFVIAHL